MYHSRVSFFTAPSTTTIKNITGWRAYLRNLCLKWITFHFNVVHHRQRCTCSFSLCFFHSKVVSIVAAYAPTWFMSHLSCLIFLTPQTGCARLACCATPCDHCLGMARSSLIKLNYLHYCYLVTGVFTHKTWNVYALREHSVTPLLNLWLRNCIESKCSLVYMF